MAVNEFAFRGNIPLVGGGAVNVDTLVKDIQSTFYPSPLNYTIDEGTPLMTFNTLAGKTTAGTKAIFTIDTVRTYKGLPTTKVTTDITNFAEIGIAAFTANKLSGVMAVIMYVEDWTKLHSILMYIGTASYAAAFKSQHYFAAIANESYSRNGWQVVYFTPTYNTGSEPQWVVDTGAPVFGTTDFTAAKIRINPMSGQTTTVNVAAIITDAKALSKINICIDDGWIESFTIVHRYCAARRVNVNYGIISDLVGTGQYCSEAQLRTMYNSGYADFATHGVLAWGVAPDADVKAELLRSRDYLLSKGWDRAANYIIYPEGKYDSNLIAWAQANGFVGARTVNRANTGTALGVSQLWHSPTSLNMLNTITAVDAVARLTKLIQCGMTMFTVGHRFATVGDGSLTWATADFYTFIDAVITERAAGRVEDTLISSWLQNAQTP